MYNKSSRWSLMDLGLSGLTECATFTKISNSIFQLEFFQDWELAQNQLDTIGHNWTQLDTIGHNWTQLDTIGLFSTHFRPTCNWTRLHFFSQLDKNGSNWTFVGK